MCGLSSLCVSMPVCVVCRVWPLHGPSTTACCPRPPNGSPPLRIRAWFSTNETAETACKAGKPLGAARMHACVFAARGLPGHDMYKTPDARVATPACSARRRFLLLATTCTGGRAACCHAMPCHAVRCGAVRGSAGGVRIAMQHRRRSRRKSVGGKKKILVALNVLGGGRLQH
jgi:hypothetical protein